MLCSSLTWSSVPGIFWMEGMVGCVQLISSLKWYFSAITAAADSSAFQFCEALQEMPSSCFLIAVISLVSVPLATVSFFLAPMLLYSACTSLLLSLGLRRLGSRGTGGRGMCFDDDVLITRLGLLSLLLLWDRNLSLDSGWSGWGGWWNCFHRGVMAVFIFQSIRRRDCFKYISLFDMMLWCLVLFCLSWPLLQLSLCPSGSNTNCLPCPNQCQTCSSSTECSTCQVEFYPSALSLCSACPISCQQCNSPTTCTTCSNPYVLVDNACSLCTIINAASCLTTVAANACKDGYYLSSGYCNSCLLNCIKCTSAYDCSACTTGYYLNASIATCNPCPNHCNACDQYTPTTCTACAQGYQLTSGSCLVVSCSVSNCLYCSSAGQCQRCQSSYYWNGSGCVLGASISCEWGANGPLPNNCINSCSSFAFVSGNASGVFRCLMYQSVYVYPVEYAQRYYYAYNAKSQLDLLTSTSTALLLNSNEYGYPLSGALAFASLPNYYRIVIAVKYWAASSIEVKLTATTPTESQNESFVVESSGVPVATTLSTTVVHSYNLKMEPNGTLTLVELLLRISRCSKGCTVCLNQQLCQRCDAPNFMLSYECVSNCSDYVHFMANMTCLSACPNNYYQTESAGSKYCTPCVAPCLTCTNASFCLSCTSGYYYLNSACSTSCPPGYYPSNATSTCQSCVSPCRTCTSESSCLSCSLGYWSGSGCASACASGQFGNDETNSCVACGSSCLTCVNSATTCTSCNSSFYFYSAQCLASCPSRYYPSSGACLECLPPCYTCTSSAFCLSCSFNYLLNGTCLSSCPGSYYQDQTALSCLPCSAECLTCSSSYSCTSCKSGCLFSGQCPSGCPSLSFFGQVSNGSCSCQQCIYPCSTCSDSSSCLSCVDGFLSNTSCVVSCPSAYFGSTSTGKCELCSTAFSHCQDCVVSGCSVCSAGYYLLNGTCLTPCPAYYYPSVQACSLCVAPCLTCSDPATCLTCVSPYSLFGSACLLECPSGMIPLVVSQSSRCTACSSPCLTCSVTASNCTYCVYGFYLWNYQCLSNCSSVVPVNEYYSMAASSSCQPCAFPCKTCSSETQCLSCKIGYWNNASLTCSQCSLGTYSSGGACLPCPSACTICYSASFCSACAPNYYLLLNHCLNDSALCYSSGYYVAGNVCYQCLQPCATCAGTASNCTSCLSGYISFQHQCLTECPAGYFRSNASCLVCAAQCATCVTGSSYCLSCASGYLLLSTVAACLSSCPAGTYQSGTICSLCQYPCLTCASEADCLSCTTGVLIGSACYTTCLSGYFAYNNTCSPCSSPCSECAVVATNCTQCVSSYWLLSSACTTGCPTGYFGESQSRQCLPCVGLCRECSSYVNCTACGAEFIYFVSNSSNLGQCVSSCPAGYYLSSNSCLPCLSSCLTCASGNSCLLCSGTLVQLSGVCLAACPAGMYVYGGVCANCSLPCLNCLDSYTCTSCLSGDLLVGGSSCLPGPACPSGYYLLVDAPQCDKKCPFAFFNLVNGTCNNVSCGELHFMGADMYCYSQCPAGYLANTTYHCVPCQQCSGLTFDLSYKIIKDELYLYLTFSETPYYAFAPVLQLTPSWTILAINSDGIVSSAPPRVGSPGQAGATNITFLVKAEQSIQTTYLTVSFAQPLLTFNNPLQKGSATILVSGYDKYSQLPDWSGLGGLAVVVAVVGLAKNPYMVDFAQTLFLVGLVDSHFPFHLASFLEGTRIAHLNGVISLEQDGPPGEGKFMYLTGTSFIANTLANWILFFAVMGLSLVLYGVLACLRRRMGYSKIHDNNQALPEEQEVPCCLSCLSVVFEGFRLRVFNRLVYFNYAIVSLFALVQLANFSTASSLSLLSSLLSLLVLLLLFYYAVSLREDKPKYTFLYLRKMLISGAVVLSLKDAIYAIGIISVCNLTAAVLILTYKLEKYRYESRFLAGCEVGQLLLQCCLSFFIMVGEGNSTHAKATLCSFIAIGFAILLLAYLAEAAFELACYLWLHCRATDLRENWVLNQQEEEQTSHHSQSLNPSMKDHKTEKEEGEEGEEGKEGKEGKKGKEMGGEGLQSLLVQVKEEMREKLKEEEGQLREREGRGAFWAYQGSEKEKEQGEGVEKQPPKMLVRCVNEFSEVQGQSGEK